MQLGIPDYRTQRFTHQKGVEKVVKDNYQARDQNIFRAGEVFDKRFMYKIQKKGPAGQNFGVFFSKALLKLHFK